jgi:YidC/Oxa1 family membrane protein insertase
VLFTWQVLFPPPEPPPRVRPPAELTEPPPPAPGSSPAAAGGEALPGTPGESVALEPIFAERAESVVLENEWLRAEFDNQGAQLVSLALVDKREGNGAPLELVQRRIDTPYPFALLDGDGGDHRLNARLFAIEREAGREPAVRFRYRGPEGEAEKRFHLRADGRLDFELRVVGAGAWSVLAGPGLRARTRDELESRFDRRGAVWRSAGAVETLAARGASERAELPGRALDWVGLEDTYFLAAWIPARGLAAVRVEPVLLAGAGDDGRSFDARPLPAAAELSTEEKKQPRDLRLLFVADGQTLAGSSFWGTKQYDRLASFGLGLERTVRWGWLGFIARPMLRTLQWIHAHVTPNYGWAIVWLTVALKTVLLPLSIVSFRSMRKMQRLNPKMQAIRERYRPKLRDKQGRFQPEVQRQMNEEIMGLYRAEGVNPASGCLPILVQLPIFFAFYQLLSNAVELWRSPWLLWVTDLTAPDPYWALPIVMGITQLIQMRMTPPPPDPIQRRMIQAMPIVFTIFSLGFPAGLVLYWLTNNVLTIGQQAIYNSLQERQEQKEDEPPAALEKGKRGKKRR